MLCAFSREHFNSKIANAPLAKPSQTMLVSYEHDTTAPVVCINNSISVQKSVLTLYKENKRKKSQFTNERQKKTRNVEYEHDANNVQYCTPMDINTPSLHPIMTCSRMLPHRCHLHTNTVHTAPVLGLCVQSQLPQEGAYRPPRTQLNNF